MISWLLPTARLDTLLDWAEMPIEIYMSLAIIHQQAVVQEFFNDGRRFK